MSELYTLAHWANAHVKFSREFSLLGQQVKLVDCGGMYLVRIEDVGNKSMAGNRLEVMATRSLTKAAQIYEVVVDTLALSESVVENTARQVASEAVASLHRDESVMTTGYRDKFETISVV